MSRQNIIRALGFCCIVVGFGFLVNSGIGMTGWNILENISPVPSSIMGAILVLIGVLLLSVRFDSEFGESIEHLYTSPEQRRHPRTENYAGRRMYRGQERRPSRKKLREFKRVIREHGALHHLVDAHDLPAGA